MPTNNNTAISERLRNGLKIQQAIESIPTRVAESIVPVFDVEPIKKIQIRWAVFADAGSGTLLTASAVKRTFVTSILLSISKDVNATSIYSNITATPVANNLRAEKLVSIAYEPLTAGSFFILQTFPFPIELQKGSNILYISSTAVASLDAHATITYYEED